MNVRLYDGTVRCPECFDAASYESETSDPCLYCKATPETTSDEEWLDALSTLVIPSDTRAIILDKIQCDRCAEPATWKIVDGAGAWEDRMCSDHGAEWFPDLFPVANVA